MGEAPVDQEVVAWLAARTGAPPADVEHDLEEGARKRAFVVDELIEAGVTGTELLDLVVRLTGVDEATARSLIAAHEGKQPG